MTPSKNTYSALLAATTALDNLETKPIKKNGKTTKKKSWTKPKDKPKRPLSAYNLFFQEQREIILSNGGTEPVPSKDDKARKNHKRSHGKIGFAALAKTVAQKWKTLEGCDKVKYEEQAAVEKTRYKVELERWNESRRLKTLAEFTNAAQMYVPQFLPQAMPTMGHYTSNPSNFVAQPVTFAIPQPFHCMSGMINATDGVNSYLSKETTLSLDSSCSSSFRNGSFFAMQSINPNMARPKGDDQMIYESSLNELMSNLDDECLDFLSQI
eukprot:CAMPEP_0118690688 /NCGR_PEP_ID=MMETSP0800-20121206/10259_1 /TAXON_ID=210618 ORGANISM="Striatella unipunctata, Strain CCMP2910" /NCGR_SAMPLE_ID=MMETSP0800 /ASSEMBLY_ACC=CAM_ASM_000638 /LENGTH=267 /DNA_ID=CAMNT_0006588375 /DNA_START=365 /DNA_END=1168 /DNA_ORIENTATION=+